MSPLPEVMAVHLGRGKEGSKHLGGVTKECHKKCMIGLSTEINNGRGAPETQAPPGCPIESGLESRPVHSGGSTPPTGRGICNLATRVALQTTSKESNNRP